MEAEPLHATGHQNWNVIGFTIAFACTPVPPTANAHRGLEDELGGFVGDVFEASSFGISYSTSRTFAAFSSSEGAVGGRRRPRAAGA